MAALLATLCTPGGVAVGGLALVAAGCAAPAQQRYEDALARTGPAAEHAVHAARLVELMRGLDRLTGERLPQALDIEAARAGRVARVREAALAVAGSARDIPAAAGDLEPALDEESRAVFAGLADTLGARAQALADDADALSETALDVRLAGLRAVCDECHARFRLPR